MTLRLLEVDDYYRGFLQLLEQLTVVGSEKISLADFEAKFNATHNQTYVVAQDDKIIATGSLLIEHKFIRQLGKVGHIEDVVVDKDIRGGGWGRKILDRLVSEAKTAGCYKIILDCSQANVPFYEKCGFVVKEKQMAMYL